MGGFGDPVGRALMERGALNIANVDYDFEVYGSTLDELGKAAYEKARKLYGDHEFVIGNMDVHDDGGKYYANVQTRIV